MKKKLHPKDFKYNNEEDFTPEELLLKYPKAFEICKDCLYSFDGIRGYRCQNRINWEPGKEITEEISECKYKV